MITLTRIVKSVVAVILVALLANNASSITATATADAVGNEDSSMKYYHRELQQTEKKRNKRPKTKRPSATRQTQPPTKSPTASPSSKAAETTLLNEQEWSSNKDKWDAFLSTSINGGQYQMVYQQTAHTPQKYTFPYLVMVGKTGDVSEVKAMDGTQVSDPDIISVVKTVDEAFKAIKDARTANAAEVTVSYDDVAGYPTEVFIDPSYDIVDEQIFFTIQNVLLI